MDDETHDTDSGAPYVPTTTHDEWGAGDPRLHVTGDGHRFDYRLTEDVTRIGSAEGADIRLPATEPLHATIEHDPRDEYVLTLHGPGEMNANPEAADRPERTETLRAGARFTAGPWTLVFAREEFADHGRPFGGREGGEFSDQPAQPGRPDYGATPDASDEQPPG